MIYINSKKKVFHLQTRDCSYIFRVLPSGHLGHVFYGKKLRNNDSFENLGDIPDLAFGSSTSYEESQPGFSLNHTTLEYGFYGKGDYRNPAVSLEGVDGNRTFDFTYREYKNIAVKGELQGLPSSYANEGEESNTIEIYLEDTILNVELCLSYTVFPEKNIFTRNVRLYNGGYAPITLDKITSFSLDFDHQDFDLITLDGAWSRERHSHRRALNYGKTEISSRKGVSSPDHNPFLLLCEPSADEQRGEVYGFSLVYSGNHSSSVEVNPHDYSRVMMGINDFDFSWTLQSGETFQTPESVLAYSQCGLNGISSLFHNFIRHNIVRGEWKYKERPVLINNWEATYFDFNEKKLLNLAKEAKSLGMELFVLDDGWFGKRNSDKTSLGDWFVNTKKLPNGVKGLAEKINKLGLDFGIWVEPEMISIESELYKKHPEWLVATPHRKASPGRYQHLLDLSNQDVCDFIYESMSDLFKSANISYVKWDMNRNFSDIYSAQLENSRQKEFAHRYVLGLYDILERLTKEFPQILFESCASGGSRFDLGMFCYMPQIWTSDDTDAIERLHIQYGSSLFAPLSVMGAHVSAVPNHQVMRQTPIESRFNTEAFGLLGYELDLTKLSNFEKKVVKKQVAFYKKHRLLLQFGKFYRLNNPSEHNISLWMVVSEDKKEALLGYYQKMATPNPGKERYKLVGLDKEKLYSFENREQYIDIKQFGDLINMMLPFDMKQDGMLHNALADNYLHSVETTSFKAYGDQLTNRGFVPLQQFYGTGLDKKTSFIGDYGSRLFFLKEINS